ncbi:hypothetical protein [Spirosoma areae]
MATAERILLGGVLRQRAIHHCQSKGKGGKGDNSRANPIASGELTVPAVLWTVIVVLPVGTDDVNRITTQTQIIAVWKYYTNAAGEQA